MPIYDYTNSKLISASEMPFTIDAKGKLECVDSGGYFASVSNECNIYVGNTIVLRSSGVNSHTGSTNSPTVNIGDVVSYSGNFLSSFSITFVPEVTD